MSSVKQLSIIRKLSRRGSWLCLREKQAAGGKRGSFYELCGSRPAKGKKKQTVAPELVSQWASQGLIEPGHEGYILSAAGKSWLRRQMSSTGDFQHQHQERKIRIIECDGLKQPAIVNDSESPLRWLASRKDKSGARLLSPYQLEAGERLRADYEFAGLKARVTASWSPTSGCNSSSYAGNEAASMQENVLAARQRVVRAIAAVGPELSGILVDVCCHLKGLEQAEKAEGWPQRSGKVVLQMALNRLARHYGLVSSEEANRQVRRRLQHWGTDDFRPAIMEEEAS